MTNKTAYIGARIFDGLKIHQNHALLIDGEHSGGIVQVDNVAPDYQRNQLKGGLLAAGFVDLQVNGGGGVLLNEQPSIEGIRTICDAHRQFGTTAVLVTLITDGLEVTKQAIDAAIKAQSAKVPGFLGLHLEGPHLSIEKKGAHSSDLIRPMNEQDLSVLCEAKQYLDNLLITVAPESVSDEQIASLASAGIRVSLGHTATTSARAKASFAAGASSVTHLYNAMSPLTHREPGLVGAALNEDKVYCGLIADGVHVDSDAINIALSMKKDEGKLFLVTDAMSTIGTDQREFTLNGRRITRRDGQLTLSDGTLAGADLDMITAVRYMATHTRCELEEALRMASNYPAKYLGADHLHGSLVDGAFGNFIHLNDDLEIQSVWQMGTRAH
ncbi:MAG: N-acetylglucosamine-6-phosphate deacetylase [Pseudomonadota bacterium]